MEDAAEEVDVCVFHRLVGEKVVGHVGDAGAEGWVVRGGEESLDDDAREILHDAGDVGEFSGDGGCDGAVGAADVDEDGGVGEGVEGVVVQEVGDFVSLAAVEDAHGVGESFGAVGIFS